MDIQLTPFQIDEAFGWLMDCGFTIDPGMSVGALIRTVDRLYDGGILEFVRNTI